MPTQWPSPSTTGTPGSSCSRSVRTTSSIELSAVTVAGSESMTSRTVLATGATLAPGRPGLGAAGLAGAGQARREAVDHVAGHHVVRPVPAGRRARRPYVREHAERCRLERTELLGQQGPDQPGE